MTDTLSNPNVSAPRLLTRQQVLAALAAEVAATSLTETAKKYSTSADILAPQQLSDVLVGRANLSKRMLRLLKLRLVEFYQRVSSGGGTEAK